MKKWIPFILMMCCLWPGVSAQAAQEPQRLEPGKPLERNIAGGESHSYQITLQAGQFMRVVGEQKGIDVVLALLAPDEKPLIEANVSIGALGLEPLSHEAALSGDYRLVVRPVVATSPKGAYQVRLEVKAAVTAQDKQRISAERLLAEAARLSLQGGVTVAQTIEKAQQALPLWRELADRYWEAHTLHVIGIACASGSKYDQAIEYYNQSLAIRREIKDRFGEGYTLNDLGIAYRNLGRYEKAIEYYEQALAIHRELKIRDNEGMAIAGLGFAYSNLGRSEKAVEYGEQALAIFREVKNRVNEGRALNNLGIFYYRLSRYEKAIESYEQALVIHREVKDRTREGYLFGNLGITCERLGDYAKAIEYHEQALAIFREVKDRANEGRAFNNLGVAYRDLGRYEKAIECFEQALAIHRELKTRDSEGRTLGNLGNAYEKLRQHEKAIAYQEQALAIARETKARDIEIGALVALGEEYRSLAQYEKATRFHEQALAVARQVKQRDSEAETLNHLMLDWKARQAPRLGIFFGKQSVNAYQEIRSDLRLLDRQTQQSFLKSKEETYRQLADLLISQGRLPEAEQVIHMLKEEEYFDFIRRDQSDSPKALKAALTPEEQALEKRYREIAEQIATLGTERSALLDKPSRSSDEEQRLAKLEADLVVAGNVFQRFLDQLSKELSPSREESGKILALRDSQAFMEDLRELGKGTVALYTLVGENRYRVILTTPDFQRGFEYAIKAADLNRKVLEFRGVVQNPKLDPLPLARELYNILIGPVAKDLKAAKAQTLMWSLDGVLRYLPLAALHDGKQYLVELYQNVVFTPASQARLKDTPSRNWDALGLGVSKAHGERIPALPGVVDEMRGIIREESVNNLAGNRLGVLPGVVKLDEQFTQEAMLSELRKRHKVVHIASHFQFSPGNETNSTLLLGDGTFLSLAQIKSLPNVFGGVELLTLSACNTATGGSGANGKEVEGFAVMAQRQGAKAVVASLWPVADRSTKVLMHDFYRSREAKADTTKAEALRQAQLRLLRGQTTPEAPTTTPSTADRHIVHEEERPGTANRAFFKPDAKKPYEHPYFWAPFILIGNWR